MKRVLTCLAGMLLGVWQYTARFDLVDPAAAGRREHGNRGAYALSIDLALLPHIHFVRNPGAVREQKDAWVIGLRLEATASRRFIFKPNQLSEET